MHRHALIVPTLLACLLGTLAYAKEQDKDALRKLAVAGVLRAHENGDKARLKRIAEDPKYGPWFVANDLCFQGKYDAAEAMATASNHARVRGLVALIKRLRSTKRDPLARKALATFRSAVKRKDAKTALEATKHVHPNDPVTGWLLLHGRGMTLQRIGRYQESESTFMRAYDAADALGWIYARATARFDAASSAGMHGRWKDAAAHWRAIGSDLSMLGLRDNEHRRIGNLGEAAIHLEDLDEAQEHFQRLVSLSPKESTPFNRSTGHRGLAILTRRHGRFEESLDHARRAHALAKESRDSGSIHSASFTLGKTEFELGLTTRALERYRTAAKHFEAREQYASATVAHQTMGSALCAVGRLADALREHEAALALALKHKYARYAHDAYTGLARAYTRMGQPSRAVEYAERAYRLTTSGAPPAQRARALRNVVQLSLGLGDEERLARYATDLGALTKTLTTVRDRVHAKLTLAKMFVRIDQGEKALRAVSEAAREAEQLSAPHYAGDALAHSAKIHGDLGRREDALSLAGKAAALLDAETTPWTWGRLMALRARLALDIGGAPEAVEHARSAVKAILASLRGLGDAESITAHTQLTRVLDVGTRAAARKNDLNALVWFLESSRAVALLESLGGEQAIHERVIPEALRASLGAARLRRTLARTALRRARAKGNRAMITTAKSAWKKADSELEGERNRVERALKQHADWIRTKPPTVADLQRDLKKGEAVVYFCLTTQAAFALVIEKGEATLKALGSSDDVNRTTRTFFAVAPEKRTRASLFALRNRFVTNLALKKETTRVRLSPDGSLCFLPWPVLFGDVDVLCVPSMRVSRLLRARTIPRSREVLALGDPAYDENSAAKHPSASATSFVRLPGTKEEVKHVGTTVLRGSRANAPELLKTLNAQAVWNAIHFACHGSIDTQTPKRSALALTPTPNHNGLLTAADIRDLRLSVELTTLSACDTGRGAFVRTEGLVGLVRAFAFAGSRQVLASLWRVDDEATCALMKKFYERWNPPDGRGESAARALRYAQDYVQRQPKWDRPYFWAAWTLWGEER